MHWRVTLAVIACLVVTGRAKPFFDEEDAAGTANITETETDSATERKTGMFELFGAFVHSFVEGAAETIAEQPRDKGFQLSCTTCSLAVNLLMNYVRNKRSIEDITRTAIAVCVTFRIESEMVCEGAVRGFVKDVVHILKNTDKTEKDICGFVIGEECESKDFKEKFNWTVTLPSTPKPPVVKITPPQDGLPTLKILHLSDTHMDLSYQEGANAVCGAPLCCRASLGYPTNPKNGAGKWGDYRECDSPQRTVEHMLQHIANNHKVDYIFWTGDLPPHDIYNQSKTSNLQVIEEVVKLFLKYFPDTPIFPALGNHEAQPVNCFPQPEIKGEFSISWLYDELSKRWSNLVHHNISKTVSKGAYYSVLVNEGFRIISLNMNYCNTKNWWLLLDDKDPAQELEWLTNELLQAEQNKEKVYILGHIPPGHSDCTKVWSRNYHRIISRFENTIAAQFFGHTHYDELMLFYDDDNKRPINVAYIGPSTTPYSNLNPAYKIYTVDGNRPDSTRMVLDGESYYLNLTEANLNDNPQWKFLHSYKDAYNMSALTPEHWNLLIHNMYKDELIFNKFLRHLHRHSDVFPTCDAKCRQAIVCRMVTCKSQDFSVCHEFGILKPTDKLDKPGFLE